MHEHEARLEKLASRARRRRRKAGKAAQAARQRRSPAGPVRSGELVVRLEDLAVGYLPGRGALRPDGSDAREPVTVARAPFLAAQRGERIGIVGPNGAGKTTLLRTIAGDLPPLDGVDRVRPQRRSPPTSPSCATPRSRARPCSTRSSRRSRSRPGEARGYLARFLFRGDDAFKEVRTLSGGERSRLELALLGILPVQPAAARRADEPPRHRRPARRSRRSSPRRPATILVVSHDRRLLETICERLWVVDDGLAVPFDGGYRAWRAAVAEGWTVEAEAARRAEPRRRPPAAATPSTSRASGRRSRRRAAAPSADGRRRGRGAAAEGPPEAVEGRLPAPARGARRRARRGSACARASSSSRSGPRRSRRTSSRCAGSPASSPTSSARSPRPRTPGWSSRSRRRDARRRTVRIGITGPDRLRQVAGRRAGSRERARSSIDADDVARDVTAPGEPAHDADRPPRSGPR